MRDLDCAKRLNNKGRGLTVPSHDFTEHLYAYEVHEAIRYPFYDSQTDMSQPRQQVVVCFDALHTVCLLVHQRPKAQHHTRGVFEQPQNGDKWPALERRQCMVHVAFLSPGVRRNLLRLTLCVSYRCNGRRQVLFLPDY